MPEDQPNTPPTPPREPETFSKDYVRELREENKGWRLKANEHEVAAKAAKDAADAATVAAEKAKADATSAADKRVIRAELKAEALKAGMIDLDGLQLADLSAVKLDDKGDVIGGAEAIEALKKAKPYLFGSPNTGNPNPPPKPGEQKAKKAADMTPEEYAAARRALVNAR